MKNVLPKYLLIVLLAFAPVVIIAQTTSYKAAFDTLSIDGQFEQLYKKSNTYEEYKVMSINGYNLLKKNSLDSIQMYKQEAGSHFQEIKALKNNLTSTNSEIEGLKDELTATQQSRNSINFLGIEISKGSYNAIMWGIIFCLAIITISLFLLYQRGHHVVKETKNRLVEVQDDLEKLRQNALVREQKLARELMDYKLKNKPKR